MIRRAILRKEVVRLICVCRDSLLWLEMMYIVLIFGDLFLLDFII